MLNAKMPNNVLLWPSSVSCLCRSFLCTINDKFGNLVKCSWSPRKSLHIHTLTIALWSRIEIFTKRLCGGGMVTGCVRALSVIALKVVAVWLTSSPVRFKQDGPVKLNSVCVFGFWTFLGFLKMWKYSIRVTLCATARVSGAPISFCDST